jgi:D-alanine-D-alanine ligase
MHGERGEDGVISSLMKTCNIPIASPDIAPSAVCMDKNLTKIMLKGLGVPFLPSIMVENALDLSFAEKMGFPLIVKPCTGGSSIGVGTANNVEELTLAINNALKYSKKALVEPMVKGFTEINCACFKDREGRIIVSECEKPLGKEEVLTFTDKYQSGKREFPAKIDRKFSEKIKKITEKIYREFDFSGVIRIDFFIFEGKVLVNEINTVPGSLAYYLFCKSTKEFKNMLSEMIEFSLVSANRNSLIKKSFNSGILSGLTSKGAKTVNK